MLKPCDGFEDIMRKIELSKIREGLKSFIRFN